MTINEENQQDDLEKKIDEAEIEAQIEKAEAEFETASSFEGEIKESTQEPRVEKKEPSKALLIFRRILIWLVVIAFAFAGGFFLDTALRYQPERDKVAEKTAEIAEARDEISTLEEEIKRLSVFEEQNISLREDIDKITTHITIISARAAVADATLALEQDRQADAKLALDKVGSTLETLESMLNEDQAEVVVNMLQRHKLIIIELDDDSFSAQTDLEVLTSKLNALENTLFASP